MLLSILLIKIIAVLVLFIYIGIFDYVIIYALVNIMDALFDVASKKKEILSVKTMQKNLISIIPYVIIITIVITSFLCVSIWNEI